MIGLPCVTVSPDDMQKLMDAVGVSPDLTCEVDLRTGRVTVGPVCVTASMPPAVREAFLSGTWDATAALLEDYDAVERVAAKLPY
jgi:3-isopropylmalate/(R)-2-methylmalate dehydratase small subunit